MYCLPPAVYDIGGALMPEPVSKRHSSCRVSASSATVRQAGEDEPARRGQDAAQQGEFGFPLGVHGASGHVDRRHAASDTPRGRVFKSEVRGATEKPFAVGRVPVFRGNLGKRLVAALDDGDVYKPVCGL